MGADGPLTLRIDDRDGQRCAVRPFHFQPLVHYGCSSVFSFERSGSICQCDVFAGLECMGVEAMPALVVTLLIEPPSNLIAVQVDGLAFRVLNIYHVLPNAGTGEDSITHITDS